MFAAVPPASRGRYEALYDRLVAQLSAPASQDIARAAQLSEGLRYYDPQAAVEIMQTLESVSSAELAVRAANPRAERQLTGWLDLAWVVRNHLVEPAGVEDAVGAWKQRHPYHVLNESQALDTWLRYRQLFTPPRKVAILLPQSGGLQAAGDGGAPLHPRIVQLRQPADQRIIASSSQPGIPSSRKGSI